MKQKRINRLKDTNRLYEETITAQIEDEVLATRKDEDLFIIDTIGSKHKRRKVEKLQKNEVLTEQLGVVSKTEQKLVEKIIEKGIRPMKRNTGKKYDLKDVWGDDQDIYNNQGNGQSKVIQSKPVCEPGQSYNPSFEEHQDALAKALANELKRREEEAKKLTPFQQMSTMPMISNQSDKQLSEDSDDDSSSDLDEYNNKKSKPSERLTRAQKNKRKARSEAAAERMKAEHEMSFLKSIDRIPKVMKDLEEKERESEAKQKLRELRLLQKNSEEKKNPEEIALVPLSDELNGTLRQLVPKGVALKLQAMELVTKGKAMAKNRRKRRKYENPHGAKKVVWIPKYKY